MVPFEAKADQPARTVGRNGRAISRAISSEPTVTPRARRKHQEAGIDDPGIGEDSDAAFFG
jgi:hypothetical protein